jgi:hypothetical protein
MCACICSVCLCIMCMFMLSCICGSVNVFQCQCKCTDMHMCVYVGGRAYMYVCFKLIECVYVYVNVPVLPQRSHQYFALRHSVTV